MKVGAHHQIDVRLRQKPPAESMPGAESLPVCQPAPLQGTSRVESSLQAVLPKGAVTVRAVDKASPRDAMDNRVALVRANVAVQDNTLQRQHFGDALVALAAADWSHDNQDKVIKQLEKIMPNADDASPQAVQDMAWAVGKLRQILPRKKADTGVLGEFLAARGFRLRPADTVSSAAPSFSLDRKQFRAALDSAAGAEGGLDKRSERSLSLMVRDLADVGDIFYAQWQIQRRINDGRLDAVAGNRLRAQVDAKVDGRLSFGEIAHEIRQAKAAGFTPEAMSRLEQTLKACGADADALFYAQRVFEHQVGQAKSPEPTGASNISSTMADRLTQVKERFQGFLAPLLDGQFNRRAQHRELRHQLQAGEIDPAAYRALRAAALTSTSAQCYERRAELAQSTVAMQGKVAAMHMEMATELMKTFSEALSSDTRDASGRVIESAEERYLRRAEERQLVQRVTVTEPKVQQFVHQKARLASQQSRVRGELATAQGPAQASSLQGRMAAFKAEEQELERVS